MTVTTLSNDAVNRSTTFKLPMPLLLPIFLPHYWHMMRWHEITLLPDVAIQQQRAGKSYHCELCNKNFTKSCNLNSHVKAVHKGVRAFQCSECQKSFSRNSDLQKHIDAVHKGLRPYECTTCQKRFSQKSSLKRHREAVHEVPLLYQQDRCSSGATINKNFGAKSLIALNLIKDGNA
ncbi:hypothetical protein ACTXT7_012775 [Hymenolepis weldensis]